MIKATFSPDGNVPADIEVNLVIPSNLGDIKTSISGPIYSSQDVKVPAKDGYTANVSTITANILNDKAVTNYYVTYTRNATTTTVSTSKGTQTIDIPAGAVGTTSDPITLPTINGYDSPQIKVQYTKEGNVITDLDGNAISDTNEAKYTGSEVTLKSPAVDDKTNFTVRDSENNILDNGSQVHVDDQVSIIPPVVEGYTPYINGEKIPENGISGTIGTDGSFIPDDSTINLSEIEYKGNEIKPTIPTISAPDKNDTSVAKDSSGNTISPDQTLHVGDSVTITLPAQDGYKAFNNDKEITTVVGTIDAKGNFIPDDTSIDLSNIKYIGNEITPAIPTISTPDNKNTSTVTDSNSQPVNANEKLHVGDSVTITLPAQDGYKALDKNNKEVKTITGTIDSKGEFVPNSGQTSLNDITYVGNEITPTIPSISTPDNKGTSVATDGSNETINPDQMLHVGDSVTITLPTQDGYKALDKNNKEVKTITGTIDSKGEFVPNSGQTSLDDITYIGNEITPIIPSISTPNNKNSSVAKDSNDKTISPDQVLHVGDSVTITLPTQDGYKAFSNDKEITTVVGTIDAKGNFIPNDSSIDLSSIKYIGNEIASTIPTISTPDKKGTSVATDSSNKTISPDQVLHVGDSVTITLPTQDGYKAFNNGKEITTVVGTIDVEGNFIPNDSSIDFSSIKYIGNEITPTIPTITTPNNKETSTVTDSNSQPVNVNEKLHVGDKVTISIPTQSGYHAVDEDGNTITATESTGTIGVDGNFVSDDGQVNPADISYIGDSKKAVINNVVTPSKTTGTTTDKDGKIITNGDEVRVGDKVTVSIPVQDGYHIIDKNDDAVTATESTGTIGTDGNFVPDKGQVDPTDISYIGDKVTPNINNISTPDKTSGTVTDENGNPINDDENVQVGDKVSINLPTQNGYHLEDNDGKTIDNTQLTGTVGPNGEFVPDSNSVDPNTIKYVGNLNEATTINLKTPDGKITSLDIPAGHFGDNPVTITAQSISGFTAPSVIVSFGADGIPTIVDAKTPNKEISTSDTLTYSRIPSSHKIIQKDDEKTDIATPKQNSQNVATYSEKGQIYLYTLDKDNKMTAISYRGLAKQSTWYSDEQITIDGIQYLRVATNEWVKASQVYPYQDLNQYVRTYDKTAKVLYKSEDEIINNRVLQPNTSWFSDRTTYVINGDKYYRVAANEFVSAKDAYIYQPTNMVVKTHTDSPSKNLYTAKGELITNRSLVADSNWLVDSIVYIEGIKYYRVATNEFVKASDVDINH